MSADREPQIEASPGHPTHALRAAFSFSRIGAVYVLAAIVVVFALWVPDLFLNIDTVRQILNSSAISGMVALSLIVPLATRTFDLSIGMTMTLSGVLTAHFLSVGIAPVPAVMIGLGAALAVGLINGIVVIVLRVDSFIATLATGSLGEAFVTMTTNDQQITASALAGPFSNIAQTTIGNIILPVFYTLALSTALWVFLQHTARGRQVYATGYNQEAARLIRIRTDRLRFMSLLVSALIAGLAGVLLTSQTGAGTPGAGSPYLLSAYAAAFLGATQIHPGRFNAWGTVLAVVLLSTGVTGLGLASTPQWAPSMFTGVILIASLIVTGTERRSARTGMSPVRILINRLRGRDELKAS